MDQRWATTTADEIRGLMAKQHKTQAELAKVLGIAQAGVSRRLQGKPALDINELGIIADWLGVSITRLFGEPGTITGNVSDSGLLGDLADALSNAA